MITKKKKSSINLSKKKLLGGSSKSPKPKRASSNPLPIRVLEKEKGSRRHSAPEMGGKKKQEVTFPELIKLKKEVAGHLKKSHSASVGSLDDDDDDEKKLIRMFLNPKTEIFQGRERKQINECLNFDISKNIVGESIDFYDIPSIIVNTDIFEGYLIKVNVTEQTIGSIHLFLCKKYIPPTKSSPGSNIPEEQYPEFEYQEIHYIDDLLANIIIANNPLLDIPEFNITKVNQSVYTNRNIQNITRKSILSHSTDGMLPDFNKLLDYCDIKNLTKFTMYGYMAQCFIKIYVKPTKNDYPDLTSFGFDTIDELKCAFKEFLKNKPLEEKPPRGMEPGGAEAAKPAVIEKKIGLLALRYAAVCNVIVKDILKYDYFTLYDCFSIYKEDETIDSGSLNKMGSMCLDIFNAKNYNYHSLNLNVDARNRIVKLKPFKGIDFEFKLQLEFEINKTVEDIITSVIKSFFNVDTYMELVDIYLKIMNEKESKEYIEVYHQILLNLKKPELIDVIVSNFINIKKPRSAAKMSLIVDSKQEVEDFKSSFTYFIIILERIFINAKARGLITEHFYKKILKLSTQLGYYSILTQSKLEESKLRPGTYQRVYFFNELG